MVKGLGLRVQGRECWISNWKMEWNLSGPEGCRGI